MIKVHETWGILDSSKITCYMECPRKFFYRYILGWKKINSKSDSHLIFGKSWHLAMQALLQGKSVEEAYNDFLLCYRAQFAEDRDAEFYPKTPDNALLALNMYIKHYHNNWEPLQLETCGSVPIDGRNKIYFRLDAVVRDLDNGNIILVEHKTGSRHLYSGIEFSLSIQINLYLHALYCVYDPYEVYGAIINRAIFLKSGVDFERFTIRKSPIIMLAWLENTVKWVESIRFDIELVQDESDSSKVMDCFRQNLSNCSTYYGCPYSDFCIAWANPIKKLEDGNYVPNGFIQEWWDPRNV